MKNFLSGKWLLLLQVIYVDMFLDPRVYFCMFLCVCVGQKVFCQINFWHIFWSRDSDWGRELVLSLPPPCWITGENRAHLCMQILEIWLGCSCLHGRYWAISIGPGLILNNQNVFYKPRKCIYLLLTWVTYWQTFFWSPRFVTPYTSFPDAKDLFGPCHTALSHILLTLHTCSAHTYHAFIKRCRNCL